MIPGPWIPNAKYLPCHDPCVYIERADCLVHLGWASPEWGWGSDGVKDVGTRMTDVRNFVIRGGCVESEDLRWRLLSIRSFSENKDLVYMAWDEAVVTCDLLIYDNNKHFLSTYFTAGTVIIIFTYIILWNSYDILRCLAFYRCGNQGSGFPRFTQS